MTRRSPASNPSEHPLDRIPGWAAPAVYFGATLLLFREFILTDEMLFGTDTLSLGYMARAFFADALRTTGFPLWNPVILGGTPFIEALAGGDSFHPLSVLLLFFGETYRAIGWKLVIHVFLAGCFMYGWLRILGISRGASLLGGLGFLLAPYFVTLVFPGHDGKLYVTALTPLLFWMAEWSLMRRGLLPLAALAATVALALFSSHFQMAYFLFGAVGAYMAFRCWELSRGGEGWKAGSRRYGLFLLFSVLGAGVAGIQIIPAVDYITTSSRRAATTVDADPAAALAYSASWSLHPEEAVGLVVPEFVGSSVGGAEWTSDTYWGRNGFKLNHEYLGVLLLILAALSFLGGPRAGLRWFMVGMGGIVALFALGAHTPVWRVFYEVLPGISLFRAPGMAIFLTGFALTTLAAFGLDRAVRLTESGEPRAVLRIFAGGTTLFGVGWLLAATGVLSTLWLVIFDPGLTEASAATLERAEPLIARGFFIATLLVGVAGAAWWGYARGMFQARVILIILGILVAVDQVRVNEPFIRTLDYYAWSRPDANHQFLMERNREETPFRVFSMVERGQDVTPGMHGLDLAGGHHPNDLQRYRELIGMTGSSIPEHLATFNPNVLRLLNVRYILWPVAEYGAIEGVQPVSQLAYSDGSVHSAVYAYPDLPRARVVGRAVILSEEETLDHILDPGRFDPSVETVLNEELPTSLGGDAVQGSARWIERTPNRLVLDVDASGAALLVLSENWFQGWTATVDGVETPVLRADHTLRAVQVPAGSHRVVMEFQGPHFAAGLATSLASLLLLVAAGGTGFWKDRRAGRGSDTRR